MFETETLSLDQIKPYENNPRQISEGAIKAVADSIERYGYQQPIVVDKDYVVVVGHTRLEALKKLGVLEAPIHVARDLTEEQAKEYRLIDNKTSEMGIWDNEKLVLELREFNEDLLESYFPDVDLEIGQLEHRSTTEEDVALAADKIKRVKEAEDLETTEITCPACYYTFRVRTQDLPASE